MKVYVWYFQESPCNFYFPWKMEYIVALSHKIVMRALEKAEWGKLKEIQLYYSYFLF